MLAAFATLAFSATLWLVLVLLARIAEDSGVRILSAARAQAAGGAPAPALRVSPRVRPRSPLSAKVQPELRAAA